MDVKLNLDNEQLKLLMSEAILQALSTQQRDALLRGALEYLVTSTRDDRGRPMPSPLQMAFNAALRDAAQSVIAAELEENTAAQQQLKALITAAYEHALTGDSPGLVSRISAALVKALVPDREW